MSEFTEEWNAPKNGNGTPMSKTISSLYDLPEPTMTEWREHCKNTQQCIAEIYNKLKEDRGDDTEGWMLLSMALAEFIGFQQLQFRNVQTDLKQQREAMLEMMKVVDAIAKNGGPEKEDDLW